MKCPYHHFQIYTSTRSLCFGMVSDYCVYTYKFSDSQSVLPTTLVHQSGEARYKFRRRRPKHISEKGNVKIESTLGNVKPFAIDVKGGGKSSRRRKDILKSKQRKKDEQEEEEMLF